MNEDRWNKKTCRCGRATMTTASYQQSELKERVNFVAVTFAKNTFSQLSITAQNGRLVKPFKAIRTRNTDFLIEGRGCLRSSSSYGRSERADRAVREGQYRSSNCARYSSSPWQYLFYSKLEI